MAMSVTAFDDLKRQVSDASFSSDQLDLISQVATTNYFTSAQVGELVGLIDMSDDRVTVVEITSDRIVDMENSYVIPEYMTYSSEQEDARAILRRTSELQAEKREAVEEQRAEEQRAAERRAEEQRAAEEEEEESGTRRRDRLTGRSSSSSSQQESSEESSTMTCCINNDFYSCPDSSSARRCFPPQLGRCMTSCMMGGSMNCEMDCLDEYPPDPSGCDRQPMRDNEC